jgi:glycosyltransferase involved in cell wall biosynthesis
LDCGILHRTKGLRRKIIQLFWFKGPVARSRFVTVISKATKQDLLANVNCNSEKIKVIYVPISEKFIYLPKQYNSQRPRILQIGSALNKNLNRLIQATKEMDCTLVIIGEINNQNYQLLERFKSNYENYVGISFEEVINQYNLCDLLFFASTFEGFGMPILEAQATGRPVITSSILSMPEVGGEAAHYVDPYSIDEIQKGIEKINTDSQYRNQLIKKGLENVRRFDPKVIANQYEELYDEICKKL